MLHSIRICVSSILFCIFSFSSSIKTVASSSGLIDFLNAEIQAWWLSSAIFFTSSIFFYVSSLSSSSLILLDSFLTIASSNFFLYYSFIYNSLLLASIESSIHVFNSVSSLVSNSSVWVVSFSFNVNKSASSFLQICLSCSSIWIWVNEVFSLKICSDLDLIESSSATHDL